MLPSPCHRLRALAPPVPAGCVLVLLLLSGCCAFDHSGSLTQHGGVLSHQAAHRGSRNPGANSRKVAGRSSQSRKLQKHDWIGELEDSECNAWRDCDSERDILGYDVAQFFDRTETECAALCCKMEECEFWVLDWGKGCYLKNHAVMRNGMYGFKALNVQKSCWKDGAHLSDDDDDDDDDDDEGEELFGEPDAPASPNHGGWTAGGPPSEWGWEITPPEPDHHDYEVDAPPTPDGGYEVLAPPTPDHQDYEVNAPPSPDHGYQVGVPPPPPDLGDYEVGAPPKASGSPPDSTYYAPPNSPGEWSHIDLCGQLTANYRSYNLSLHNLCVDCADGEATAPACYECLEELAGITVDANAERAGICLQAIIDDEDKSSNTTALRLCDVSASAYGSRYVSLLATQCRICADELHPQTGCDLCLQGWYNESQTDLGYSSALKCLKELTEDDGDYGSGTKCTELAERFSDDKEEELATACDACLAGAAADVCEKCLSDAYFEETTDAKKIQMFTEQALQCLYDITATNDTNEIDTVEELCTYHAEWYHEEHIDELATVCIICAAKEPSSNKCVECLGKSNNASLPDLGYKQAVHCMNSVVNGGGFDLGDQGQTDWNAPPTHGGDDDDDDDDDDGDFEIGDHADNTTHVVSPCEKKAESFGEPFFEQVANVCNLCSLNSTAGKCEACLDKWLNAEGSDMEVKTEYALECMYNIVEGLPGDDDDVGEELTRCDTEASKYGQAYFEQLSELCELCMETDTSGACEQCLSDEYAKEGDLEAKVDYALGCLYKMAKTRRPSAPPPPADCKTKATLFGEDYAEQLGHVCEACVEEKPAAGCTKCLDKWLAAAGDNMEVKAEYALECMYNMVEGLPGDKDDEGEELTTCDTLAAKYGEDELEGLSELCESCTVVDASGACEKCLTTEYAKEGDDMEVKAYHALECMYELARARGTRAPPPQSECKTKATLFGEDLAEQLGHVCEACVVKMPAAGCSYCLDKWLAASGDNMEVKAEYAMECLYNTVEGLPGDKDDEGEELTTCDDLAAKYGEDDLEALSELCESCALVDASGACEKCLSVEYAKEGDDVGEKAEHALQCMYEVVQYPKSHTPSPPANTVPTNTPGYVEQCQLLSASYSSDHTDELQTLCLECSKRGTPGDCQQCLVPTSPIDKLLAKNQYEMASDCLEVTHTEAQGKSGPNAHRTCDKYAATFGDEQAVRVASKCHDCAAEDSTGKCAQCLEIASNVTGKTSAQRADHALACLTELHGGTDWPAHNHTGEVGNEQCFMLAKEYLEYSGELSVACGSCSGRATPGDCQQCLVLNTGVLDLSLSKRVKLAQLCLATLGTEGMGHASAGGLRQCDLHAAKLGDEHVLDVATACRDCAAKRSGGDCEQCVVANAGLAFGSRAERANYTLQCLSVHGTVRGGGNPQDGQGGGGNPQESTIPGDDGDDSTDERDCANLAKVFGDIYDEQMEQVCTGCVNKTDTGECEDCLYTWYNKEGYSINYKAVSALQCMYGLAEGIHGDHEHISGATSCDKAAMPYGSAYLEQLSDLCEACSVDHPDGACEKCLKHHYQVLGESLEEKADHAMQCMYTMVGSGPDNGPSPAPTPHMDYPFPTSDYPPPMDYPPPTDYPTPMGYPPPTDYYPPPGGEVSEGEEETDILAHEAEAAAVDAKAAAAKAKAAYDHTVELVAQAKAAKNLTLAASIAEEVQGLAEEAVDASEDAKEAAAAAAATAVAAHEALEQLVADPNSAAGKAAKAYVARVDTAADAANAAATDASKYADDAATLATEANDYVEGLKTGSIMSVIDSPTPTITAPAPSGTCGKTYTIPAASSAANGDAPTTCWDICDTYNLTILQLEDANPTLHCMDLRAGEVLCVDPHFKPSPGSSDDHATAQPGSKPPVPSPSTIGTSPPAQDMVPCKFKYTVQVNDTCRIIAETNNITVKMLKDSNVPKDAVEFSCKRDLWVGEELCIPGTKPPGSPSIKSLSNPPNTPAEIPASPAIHPGKHDDLSGAEIGAVVATVVGAALLIGAVVAGVVLTIRRRRSSYFQLQKLPDNAA